MSIWLYVFVSLLGVILCHYLSVLYLRKDNVILFIIYFLVCAQFGSQHYNVLFNNSFFETWFFIPFGPIEVGGELQLFGLLMLILLMLTLPLSSLGRWCKIVFLLVKR
ncbi:hypothetical protein GTG28_02175 [Vibrio sp. OCN044]|uniref:Uncharacterized protein n=1 Tax=Vibrio tetraodonis subsp. pristinus TaxID=2695891 RepID=A0A6L8LTR1_9VIBR|nr:hypothetical protein [Vibrio tetraodonis]MYM58020.1 hypothetical protein [Vibrio tetraodonis subsp. pristinus]